MLTAYGWIVVQASQDAYAEVRDPTQLDAIDKATDAANEDLWTELRAWLAKHGADLNYNFKEAHNWATGVLLFSVSTNHRSSSLWDLLDWIVEHGPGSYGLVYVHDDEDVPTNRTPGRGEGDHSNEFRVWRVAAGSLEELTDPFLSPIVPRVTPTRLA